MYLDLSELPQLFDGRLLWSARRPAPAWFRRADYLGDPSVALDQAVRNLVSTHTGKRPVGPIRVLTHLRYLGYISNPVSFYYCFDRDDHEPETILAEITNTPWRERHTYILAAEDGTRCGRIYRYHLQKAFHVSPFMDMDLQYDWRFSAPSRRLVVHMENFDVHRGKLFDASLALKRREIDGRTLAGLLVRFPWMTAKVSAGIYWQAFCLWLKGTPFYVHPAKRGAA